MEALCAQGTRIKITKTHSCHGRPWHHPEFHLIYKKSCWCLELCNIGWSKKRLGTKNKLVSRTKNTLWRSVHPNMPVRCRRALARGWLNERGRHSEHHTQRPPIPRRFQGYFWYQNKSSYFRVSFGFWFGFSPEWVILVRILNERLYGFETAS